MRDVLTWIFRKPLLGFLNSPMFILILQTCSLVDALADFAHPLSNLAKYVAINSFAHSGSRTSPRGPKPHI